MNWADCTLVLLPGLDGTGLLFRPLLSRFPASARIKVINYPTDQILDFDQLSELVRQQLPVEGTVFVLAESFSGPVAVRLIDHPRVTGIILCASFLRSPRPAILRISKLPVSFLLRLPVPRFALRFACLNSQTEDSTMNLVYDALSSVSPRVLFSRFRLLADLDELSRIAGHQKPTLYLRPTEDKLVPRSIVAELKNVQPSLVVRDVPGPHFLLQSSPEEGYAALCEFCSGVLAAT